MTKSAAFPGLILFAVALLSGHLRTNIAAVTSIIHPFLLSSLPLDDLRHFQPYLADGEAAASKRTTRSTRAAAARGQGVVSRVSSARSVGLATSRVLLCSDRQLREEETDRQRGQGQDCTGLS